MFQENRNTNLWGKIHQGFDALQFKNEIQNAQIFSKVNQNVNIQHYIFYYSK